MTLGAFSSSLCHKIASWIGYDADYHSYESTFQFYLGLRHLYRLNSRVLVPTINLPNQEMRLEQGKIMEAADAVIRMHSAPEYLSPMGPKFRMTRFDQGMCQGILLVFSQEFDLKRREGKSYEEAAVFAAYTFYDGGPLSACVMQFLHQSYGLKQSLLDTFALNREIDSAEETQHKIHVALANSMWWHYLLGADESQNYGILDQTTLTELSDGFYEVIIGNWPYIQKEGWHWYYQEWAHATALIKYEGNYLIFDPAIALYRTNNPMRDFDRKRDSLSDEIIYHKITYTELSTLEIMPRTYVRKPSPAENSARIL